MRISFQIRVYMCKEYSLLLPNYSLLRWLFILDFLSQKVLKGRGEGW